MPFTFADKANVPVYIGSDVQADVINHILHGNPDKILLECVAGAGVREGFALQLLCSSSSAPSPSPPVLQLHRSSSIAPAPSLQHQCSSTSTHQHQHTSAPAHISISTHQHQHTSAPAHISTRAHRHQHTSAAAHIGTSTHGFLLLFFVIFQRFLRARAPGTLPLKKHKKHNQ